MLIKNYANLSLNFFNITKVILEENIKWGNGNIYPKEGSSSLSGDDFIRYADDAMKFNDNKIGIAIIFNFLHGLELFLKTLNKINGLDNKKTHKLTSLYFNLENKINNKEIKQILDLYLKNNSSFLNSFFINNNKTIDDFYIILRYPEDKEIFNYDDLIWQENNIIPFYKELVFNINELMIYLVRLTRKNMDEK